MAFVGYLLLILIPAAAVAYIIWEHKRRTAERNVASAGRLHELLGTAVPPQPHQQPSRRSDFPASSTAAPPAEPAPLATPPPPAAIPLPAASASPAAATPSPAPGPREDSVAPLYAVRERVLSTPQTLLYYLLRTGIPDHVIFARVPLAALLEAGPGLSGFAREEQSRRLAAITVDFLVSDKSMRPVAVIELKPSDQGSAAQADRASARTRLAAAGVRYLEIDPSAMPRKDALRALVLDADAEDATRSAPENVAS